MFTIYGVLNSRANTSRIYLPRKKGGRGLISAADCVTMEQLRLNHLFAESGNAAKSYLPVLKPNSLAVYATNDERMADWKKKPLHGQFVRHTERVISNIPWTWFKRRENLRRRQKDC